MWSCWFMVYNFFFHFFSGVHEETFCCRSPTGDPTPWGPKDILIAHLYAQRYLALGDDGSDFWKCNGATKALKRNLDTYLAHVEYRILRLRDTPRFIADKDVVPSVQIRMVSDYDAEKSLNKQEMTEHTLELEMSEEKVTLLRDTAQYVKDTPVLDTKAGVKMLLDYTIMDLQFQYGCDIDWTPTPVTEPGVGRTVDGGAPTASFSGPCDSSSSQAATESSQAATASSQAAAASSRVAAASSQAAAASSSSDGESPYYESGDDRGGDRNVVIMCWDYEDPLSHDWNNYKYPIADHFIDRFREAHAIALMFFFNEKLQEKYPVLWGQINRGWQFHFKRPIQFLDVMATQTHGDGYDEEERDWMNQAAKHFISNMTPEQLEEKGIGPDAAAAIMATKKGVCLLFSFLLCMHS